MHTFMHIRLLPKAFTTNPVKLLKKIVVLKIDLKKRTHFSGVLARLKS
jgi:hypothetical protein